jgi:hypothetical protein
MRKAGAPPTRGDGTVTPARLPVICSTLPLQENIVLLHAYNPAVSEHERDFRQLIRDLVGRGTYPDHTTVRNSIGRRNGAYQLRSGLTTEETRWRIEEMTSAGYDWEASKKAGRLVRGPMS